MKYKFSYFLILIIACCLAGCSNSKNDLNQKELVYGYERLACMDEIKGDILNFDAAGDSLYIYVAEYEEEEKEEVIDSYFYKCKTDGSEAVRLPMKLGSGDFEWLYAMESAEEGTLWLLFSVYDEGSMTSTYILRKADDKGNILKEIDLKEYVDVEDFFVSAIKTDAEHNLYVCSGYGILLFDMDGAFIGNIEGKQYIENMVCSKDGTVWAGFYKKRNYILKRIDPDKKAYDETYNTNLPFEAVVFDMDGLAYDFYYRQDESLFGYNMATEELPGGSTEVIHFMASGLNTNSFGKMQVIAEDTVLAAYGVDSEDNSQDLYLIRKKDPKDIKEKKIVTYASLFYDSEVKEMALQFNESQDKYLVLLKNYENTDDGRKEFYKDLRSGEVIDIVDLNGMSSSDKFIAQNMFVDLYTFMKRDRDVKKEDFSENVLYLMETDGKLYHISPMYGINGMFAKKSSVSGEGPLTIDRLRDMEKEGTKAFAGETKSSVLIEMLSLNYDSYIDWMSGNCCFDSEEFVKVLEYCDTYPQEIDYSEENEEEAIFANVYSVAAEDFQVYEEMFGEEVVMIGYPSEEFSGAAVSFHRDFAICASSEDKKGAWAFMKQFLSREYGAGEPNETISVPVRKDSLEDKIRRYTMTEEYTDEFGNQILPISYEWANDEIVMEVEPLDKRREGLYRDVLQKMDRRYVYDADIQDILCQETEPYFDGDISAKEAAVNIQERVSVYMADYKKEEAK